MCTECKKEIQRLKSLVGCYANQVGEAEGVLFIRPEAEKSERNWLTSAEELEVEKYADIEWENNPIKQ